MTTCAVCWMPKELTLFRGDLWCTECREQCLALSVTDRLSPTATLSNPEREGCLLCCEDGVELTVAHTTTDGHRHGLACQPCQDALLNSYAPKCTTCNLSLPQTPEQESNGYRAYLDSVNRIWNTENEEDPVEFRLINGVRYYRTEEDGMRAQYGAPQVQVESWTDEDEVQREMENTLQEYLEETRDLRVYTIYPLLRFAQSRRSEITSSRRLRELSSQYLPHLNMRICRIVYKRFQYLERSSEVLLFEYAGLFNQGWENDVTPMYKYLCETAMNDIQKTLEVRGFEIPEHVPAHTCCDEDRLDWITSLWRV